MQRDTHPQDSMQTENQGQKNPEPDEITIVVHRNLATTIEETPGVEPVCERILFLDRLLFKRYRGDSDTPILQCKTKLLPFWHRQHPIVSARTQNVDVSIIVQRGREPASVHGDGLRSPTRRTVGLKLAGLQLHRKILFHSRTLIF